MKTFNQSPLTSKTNYATNWSVRDGIDASIESRVWPSLLRIGSLYDGKLSGAKVAKVSVCRLSQVSHFSQSSPVIKKEFRDTATAAPRGSRSLTSGPTTAEIQ